MSKTPSAPAPSAEERAAINAQNQSIAKLTAIAEEQFKMSKEDIAKYKSAFEDPSGSTDSKGALAELQSKISGKTVNPSDLVNKGLEEIIRDTMLMAPAEFSREAEAYIGSTTKLAEAYGDKADAFTKSLVNTFKSAGDQFKAKLGKTADEMGTIDQKILAEETGAATAGISSAFAEGRKQLESNLARRGLAGSGLDTQAQLQLTREEALSKFGAQSQARVSARGLSDQLRMQKLNLARDMYGTETANAQAIYGAQMQGAQTQFGIGSGQAQNIFQTKGASTQQALQTLGMTQAQGQGIYQMGANIMGQSAGTFNQSATQYGGIAGGLRQDRMNTYNQQVASSMATNQAIGSMVGTGIGFAAGKKWG